MLRALNTNLLSTTGRALEYFKPAQKLEYTTDRIPLQPAYPRDRPLLKGVTWLSSSLGIVSFAVDEISLDLQ